MRNELCEILHRKMLEYIEARAESVRWLSQKVGLPYSTVYRLISGETNSCTFRNAYQILKVVAPQESRQILVHYFPNFAPLIERDNNFVENESKIDRALDLTLRNRMFYLVHSMASTSIGTSRSEIKEIYGRVGIEALDHLLEQEVLVEKRNGEVRDLLSDTVQTNEDHLVQMIRYNLDSFDAEDRFSGIVNIVEGFSEAGTQQVCALLRETFQKLLEIRAKPENLGQRRLFTSILYGQIGSIKTEEKGEKA